MWDNTIAPEEVYNEFISRAANMIGNLAGRAVRGVSNVANSFRQGYQQGNCLARLHVRGPFCRPNGTASLLQ